MLCGGSPRFAHEGGGKGRTIDLEEVCGLTEDPLAVELEDNELLAEVELTSSLIVAANQSEAHLSLEEIDRILGVG